MSWTDDLSEGIRIRLKKQDQPKWTSPMLATLTRDPFSDDDWMYERKLDGQRLLAFRSGSNVRRAQGSSRWRLGVLLSLRHCAPGRF